MPAPRVLSGPIPTDGAIGLLREIEALHTTGVLRFESGQVRGEVQFVAGQLAAEQATLADGVDAVEAFLALRSGTFELFQRLPPLPVSTGDDTSRTGSLAVHVPADLMNYCESAGLTGVLELVRRGRRAEVVYDGGELVGIRLDGKDDADLQDVFAWEDGTFRIEARSAAPEIEVEVELDLDRPKSDPAARPAPDRKDDTGQHLLRVVEVALTSIVEDREKRRSPTRTSPPLPSAPKARAVPSTLPPPNRPKKRKGTVRVVYLQGQPAQPPPSVEVSTRVVRTDVTGEVMLPEASPERRTGERPALPRPTGLVRKDRDLDDTPPPKGVRKIARNDEPAGQHKTGEHGVVVPRVSAELPPEHATEHVTDRPPVSKPEGSLLRSLGWALLVLLLGIGLLALLARLPALE